MVYDVMTRSLDQIPLLLSRRDNSGAEQQHCGIHSVQINPSRTLLATGARNTCDIAVYKLPTLDPVCVGESANRDWVKIFINSIKVQLLIKLFALKWCYVFAICIFKVFDTCWLDDEFLVSGSRDTKMALWRITPDICEAAQDIPRYKHISAISVKECRNAQKVLLVTILSLVLVLIDKNYLTNCSVSILRWKKIDNSVLRNSNN